MLPVIQASSGGCGTFSLAEKGGDRSGWALLHPGAAVLSSGPCKGYFTLVTPAVPQPPPPHSPFPAFQSLELLKTKGLEKGFFKVTQGQRCYFSIISYG